MISAPKAREDCCRPHKEMRDISQTPGLPLQSRCLAEASKGSRALSSGLGSPESPLQPLPGP